MCVVSVSFLVNRSDVLDETDGLMHCMLCSVVVCKYRLCADKVVHDDVAEQCSINIAG